MTVEVPRFAAFSAFDVRFAPPVPTWAPRLSPVQIGALAVFAVAAVTLGVRWRPLGALSTPLGRRTPPVYVLHLPPLFPAVVLLGDRPPAAVAPDVPVAVEVPVKTVTPVLR